MNIDFFLLYIIYINIMVNMSLKPSISLQILFDDRHTYIHICHICD